MNPINLFWLFASPAKGWRSLVQSRPSIQQLFLLHAVPFSLIPPLMVVFAGSTYGGQFFPGLSPLKLLVVAAVFFTVEMIIVPFMGVIIRQLGEVAEIQPSYKDAFILAAVAPTPLWIAPVFLLVPSVMLNLFVVSAAMMATAGFIYYGIPTVLKLEERGHAMLLFGAILTAGVVTWGLLMVSTLVAWGSIQNLPL